MICDIKGSNPGAAPNGCLTQHIRQPIGLMTMSWEPSIMLPRMGTNQSGFAYLACPTFFGSLSPATIGNNFEGSVLGGGVYGTIYLPSHNNGKT
jgi:hypothetical protein